WLVCTDPEPMLFHIRSMASTRKLRQFAIGWAMERSTEMEDDRSRIALDVAERFIEGEASQAELSQTFRDAPLVCSTNWLRRKSGRDSKWGRSNRGSRQALNAATSARDAANPGWDIRSALNATRTGSWTDMAVIRARLLRDIFGNPFRPVTLDPSWLTSN